MMITCYEHILYNRALAKLTRICFANSVYEILIKSCYNSSTNRNQKVFISTLNKGIHPTYPCCLQRKSKQCYSMYSASTPSLRIGSGQEGLTVAARARKKLTGRAISEWFGVGGGGWGDGQLPFFLLYPLSFFLLSLHLFINYRAYSQANQHFIT